MEEKALRISAESKSSTIYMLRTSQQNHIQLTVMADNKANILIAACFVTISVISARLVASGWEPIFGVVLPFALLSALSAAFAVMPRSRFQPPNGKSFNMLFFGHYTQLPVEDYLDEMNGILSSEQHIYETMLRDIYAMGCVLRKKYRFLRYSYLLFVVGMLSPVIYYISTLLV